MSGPDDAPLLAASVVQTLVLYALAEHQQGHASVLRVQARGHAFEVHDDGRGHTIDRTVEGVRYIDLIYRHLDDPSPGALAVPVQWQGLGLSLLNRLCEALQVTVHRADTVLHLHFRHGAPVGESRGAGEGTPRGIRIAGQVAPRWDDRPIDEAALARWLAPIAQAHPGLRVVFNGRAIESGA